ncbi:hypothetical protein CERZMDRAFT_96264 [Cercospora zeae-maydis SCOH1-5]|uniref:Zn(2)-C6 fungal-type domain-containing protein n=1 Tax=Cercospora zeae-maydis SCOH1-5 TaxID=717836 RepID=A0A6A6FJ39_9PEZI|nr:hypothetical protein CERZMDRAFT_96264 [Cercospora zeae-maydis SCOH1-5]
MARRKGKRSERASRISCVRCAKMKLLCDAPGDCTLCRMDGVFCRIADNAVVTAQHAVKHSSRFENHAAGTETTDGAHPHLAQFNPPIDLLLTGRHSLHLSGTKQGYYVTPTGHVQRQCSLQCPPPVPPPAASLSQANRLSTGPSSVLRTEDTLSPRHIRHNKRKGFEDENADTWATLGTSQQGPEISAPSHPSEQTFGIQRRSCSSSNGAAVPPTSNYQFRKQKSSEYRHSSSGGRFRDMLPNVARLIEQYSEGTDGQRAPAQIRGEEQEDFHQKMTKVSLSSSSRRNRLRRERKLARTPAENEALRQTRIRQREKKKLARAAAKAAESKIMEKKRIQEQKESEVSKAAAEAESLRQKRIQERNERRLARAVVKKTEAGWRWKVPLSSISTTQKQIELKFLNNTKDTTIHNRPPRMHSFSNIVAALAFAASAVNAAPSAQLPSNIPPDSAAPPANAWLVSQTSADCNLGGETPCEYSFHVDSPGSDYWPPFSADCKRTQITGSQGGWWPCTLQPVDNAKDFPQFDPAQVYSWLNFDDGYNGNVNVYVAAVFNEITPEQTNNMYEAAQQFTFSNWAYPHVDYFALTPKALLQS